MELQSGAWWPWLTPPPLDGMKEKRRIKFFPLLFSLSLVSFSPPVTAFLFSSMRVSILTIYKENFLRGVNLINKGGVSLLPNFERRWLLHPTVGTHLNLQRSYFSPFADGFRSHAGAHPISQMGKIPVDTHNSLRFLKPVWKASIEAASRLVGRGVNYARACSRPIESDPIVASLDLNRIKQ